MLLSPADQPTTKLSGLFGEIQQKLFLWEFHLLELQHNGQCICNALQKAICTGMFDIHHTLLVSEAILRRRLQCTSVVKLVHSPLLLLNISFCLYWLLHSCNKQYPYKWPAKSPQALGAAVALFPLDCVWFISGEFSCPPSLLPRPRWRAASRKRAETAVPTEGKSVGIKQESLCYESSLGQNNY